MPAFLLGDLIVSPILEFIFGVVGYHVGRMTVATLSLGSWSCDRFLESKQRQAPGGGGLYYLMPQAKRFGDLSRDGPRLGGVYHRRGGRVFLSAEVTAFLGLIVSLTLTVGVGYLSCAVKGRQQSSARQPAVESATNQSLVPGRP